ncbi:pathogenesis-related protein STH-2-like [Helianthus annuus]|uniref:pathogenesis-related protein STH-2-like n=1 Tax=Helianthus annuus TaxID=4232 RepID=UPI001652E0B5|nr:pathogenesis-related protein STH-2-like [Helianthus annuus]
MGVLTYTDEHTSPVIPFKIFKASILDLHNSMPKLYPDAITSIKFIKDKHDLTKHVDRFREAPNREVDRKLDMIEKVSYDIKFEGSPDGGCISKITTTIYMRG